MILIFSKQFDTPVISPDHNFISTVFIYMKPRILFATALIPPNINFSIRFKRTVIRIKIKNKEKISERIYCQKVSKYYYYPCESS